MPTQVPAYFNHFRAHVLPVLHQVDGYAGATLLQGDAAGTVEIMVITWWQSRDAIREFAGPELERAVVADEAASLLVRFDDRVRHYHIALTDNA